MRFHLSSFWLFSSMKEQLPGVCCKLFAPLLVVCLHEPTNKVAGSLPVQEGVQSNLMQPSSPAQHISILPLLDPAVSTCCVPVSSPTGMERRTSSLHRGYVLQEGSPHCYSESTCILIQSHSFVVLHVISRYIQMLLQYKPYIWNVVHASINSCIKKFLSCKNISIDGIFSNPIVVKAAMLLSEMQCLKVLFPID